MTYEPSVRKLTKEPGPLTYRRKGIEAQHFFCLEKEGKLGPVLLLAFRIS